jgi:hypothetical protein
MRVCKIDGCGYSGLGVCRGLCPKHYARLKRNGDPTIKRKCGRKKTPASARFFSFVNVIRGGCWEWAGFVDKDGYGHFMKETGLHVGAHRFSYELFVGDIPEDMQIDHLCRNRKCINPTHLEVVTLKENVLRGHGITATNLRKTRCVNGHEFSELNTMYARGGEKRVCAECSRRRCLEYQKRKREVNYGVAGVACE